MTGAADPDDPTELAPASDTETRSDHAWALTEDDDDIYTQRLTPRRITAAAVAASIVVIAAAAGITVWQLQDSDSARVAEPAPTTTTTPPAPPPHHLNGTYRVDYHWDQSTFRNTQRDVGGNVDWGPDESAGPPTEWLTLATNCTDMGCIATGQVLTQDRRRIQDARTLAFELRNGTWEEMAPARVESECTFYDGRPPLISMQTIALTFTPRPDGTFSGTLTATIDTDECGDQGNTSVTPLTATRVGDAI